MVPLLLFANLINWHHLIGILKILRRQTNVLIYCKLSLCTHLKQPDGLKITDSLFAVQKSFSSLTRIIISYQIITTVAALGLCLLTSSVCTILFFFHISY